MCYVHRTAQFLVFFFSFFSSNAVSFFSLFLYVFFFFYSNYVPHPAAFCLPGRQDKLTICRRDANARPRKRTKMLMMPERHSLRLRPRRRPRKRSSPSSLRRQWSWPASCAVLVRTICAPPLCSPVTRRPPGITSGSSRRVLASYRSATPRALPQAYPAHRHQGAGHA